MQAYQIGLQSLENVLTSQRHFQLNAFPYKDKDLVVLLSQLGYEKFEMAGSRVRFFNEKTEHMILLHRPHPENEIKGGALKAVKQALKQEGFL